MIQVKNSTIHYINERALTFSENDLDDPQRVAVSLVSGTVVMAYVPGTIDYAADGNYERWTLKGYSTKLISDAAHQVYARLSRTERTALIVFSVKSYNVDGSVTTVTGKDEEGNDITDTTDPSADYFYIKIGALTATDGISDRELTYDSGLLSTRKGDDELGSVNDMWELDKYSTPWLIRAKQWLSDFTVKGFVTLIGGLVFKKGDVEKPVVDIKRSTDSGDPDDVDYVPVNDETIPTTAWVESRSENRYLKKYEPDETQFRIKFFDGVECGEFVEGPLKILGGSGTRFDGDGYGEMNGLRLREFLEVPELRFNRIDVVSGILWNSIAFGLVETVDENLHRCTLKLEDGERSGLKVNDICMGIFSDFGEGTVEDVVDPETGEVLDPGDDVNGLPRMYGFSTSYFTPTSILKNDAGVFEFEYSLQPGTSVHPKPSMKFAVYGNFLDERRQASAYSTRTYKRYLNKVNTWKVDPEKNIYAQFGKLDGLTISGMQMTGYGSYQHNTYFTGVQIQFTKEQKEDLKGQDAYSVSLSDYVGIVRMTSDGTVVGGEYVPLNVVSEGENVITGDQNVVTRDYLLKTRIQAYRGAEELSYSESVDAGSYIASVNPVGCVAVVENGVVCISEVTNMEYSYVKIAVNCEGNASFEMTYQVKLVKDGDNFIYADVDNEMDSVSCDKDGNVLFGLPVSCTARMYAGLDAVAMDRIEVIAPEGVVASGALSEDALSAVVEVTGIAQETDRVIPVDVYLYATYKGMQHVRKLVFTVAKQMQGENGVIYKLSPSATALKPSREDKQQTLAIYCGITKHDGVQVSKLNEMPEGYSMKYRIGDAGEEGLYVYEDILRIAPDSGTVTFSLYYGEELIDVETIPVLLDGNSAFRSTVFLRSNEEPSTPSATGSYESPVPEDVDGNELPLWSDGIPPGDAMLWSSSRVFSIDGLYPQEDGWSVPVRMTDTASFDVEFSSVQVNPGNPTDNPDNWSNEAMTDTWWMATRVMKNGEWNGWQISQIKGEKGDAGVAGKYYTQIFISSVTVPETPEGNSEEIPSGWSTSVPEKGDITCKETYSGEWTNVGEYRKSPKITSNGFTKERISFTVTSETIIEIRMTASSEANYDFGYIGQLDTSYSDASSIASNYLKRVSGTESVSVYLSLTAGTHYIEVVYTKDGSSDKFEDCIRYKVYCRPEVWMSKAYTEPTGNGTELYGTWSNPIVYLPTDGTNGKDGENAMYYEIKASVGSIGYSSLGYYSPSSFVVSEYTINGGSRTPSNKYYIHIYGLIGDTETYLTYSSSANQYRFDASAYIKSNYDSFRFDLRTSSSASSSLVAVGTSITVPVAKDGSNEAAGSMPYNCGEYSSTARYYYNADRRDIVTYEGGVYMVKSFDADGYISGYLPTNSTYWTQASQDIFRAMDTALIDGANIAGFTFKNNVMQSQTGTLTLDGINGEITALAGYIGNWKIVDGAMSTEGTYYGDWANSPFKNTLDVSGMQVSINSDDITARFGVKKVTFSEDGYDYFCSTLDIVNAQTSGSRRTDPMCGIHIKGNKNDLGLFIEGTGIYISPESGAYSRVKGLGLNARVVSTTTTLSTNDDIVIVSNNATVTLPSAGVCAGKIYIVKILSGTLKVNGVYKSNSSSVTSSGSWTDSSARMFVSANGYWVEFLGA